MIGDSKGTDIAVWLTNFYIDCELPADWDGQTTRFSLSEITSKGIVAENRCGSPTREQAIPGTLIVYKRKMTRKEKHLI